MSGDTIDLKEKKIPKGIIQKFIDAENKIENDDRKEQMRIGLESINKIERAVEEHKNAKEGPVEEEKSVDSAELARQIQEEMER